MSRELTEPEKMVLRKEMMKLKDEETLLEIKIDAIKWAKMQVLYDLGHSDAVISRSLDLSTALVGGWRKRRGLSYNKIEYGTHEIKDEEKPYTITKGETMNKRRLDLHKRGLSIQEIAECEGVDKYTIMKHFRDRGIPYSEQRVSKNDKN